MAQTPPEDVLQKAREVHEEVWGPTEYPLIEPIARAIMEERERCARLIEGGFARPVGKPWRRDGWPSKNDLCPHNRAMYEDCELCCVDAIRGYGGKADG